MSNPLGALTRETRHGLAVALDAGRLAPPYTALALRRYVGAAAESVASELARLAELGVSPAGIRELLRLLDGEARARQVSLVWTGPEERGAESRDTGVVLRELFSRARRSVLVAGFAVYQGKNVFKVLADRLDADPVLDVRLFLNVERKYGDTTIAADLLKRFADRFRKDQWPGQRMPQVFHDPRTTELRKPGVPRAALHAKCVVVDDEVAFVTSANFTEAAQERNIEVGVLVEDADFARALRQQFDSLVESKALARTPGM